MKGVALKHLCQRPPEYGLNISPDRYGQAGIRLLRTSDVSGDGKLDEGTGVYLDRADVPSEYQLATGDVLFSRSGTIGRAFLFDRERHGEATFAGFLVRFRLRPDIDPRAIRYWSESAPFAGAVEAGAVQSTISNFNAERYANLEVPAELVAASREVADYLDAESARLDAVMSRVHRLTSLLIDRRRTVIGAVITGTHPATVGLLDGTPTRKLSVFASVDLGRARSPETANGPNMVPYLRAANVKDGYLELDSILEMHFSPTEVDHYQLLPGDVLVTEGAGSIAAVGATAVWQGEISGPVCFQNHLLRIRATSRSDPRFIAWWARFAYESGLFASLASGAQILNLGADGVRSLAVRLPGRDAQGAIADLLDAEVGRLEGLIDLLRRLEAALSERRQALITAAVTGELDLPGVAA